MSTDTVLEPLDQYRDQARQWIAANLRPRPTGTVANVAPQGKREQSPSEVAANRALQKKLYQAGYAGITWPADYGGQGLPIEYERAFLDEASGYYLPDLGNLGGATMSVCAPTMLAHASPEFLRRHIPRILAWDEMVSQFFSDPDAGSDLAGVRTHAVRDGDRWILNGSKIWSSGAHIADVGMCLARTDWDVPKHRGLTWFLVPTNAPGVTVERIRQITGDSEFCQEFFTDVELTDDDIIGQVNDGWTVTQTMLLYERGGGMARSGISQAASVGLAGDLARFADAARSSSTAAQGESSELIARIHVNDLAKAALQQRLGSMMAANPQIAASIASYGKLASGVFDPIRAQLMMRLAGTAGVAWAPPEAPSDGPSGDAVSAAFLASRFMAIAGGTVQMQRNIIGERVLRLPREPTFDSRKPFRDVVRDSRDWSGTVG